MTGKTMNKRLGQDRTSGCMFIFFNLTFFPMFLVGLLGQPRRVFEYAQNLQALNDFSSVSAFLLGASFLIFIANFVWSIFIKPKPAAGQSVELARPRMADRRFRCRYYNFERIPVVLGDPYHYSEDDAPPVADLGPRTLVWPAQFRPTRRSCPRSHRPPASGRGLDRPQAPDRMTTGPVPETTTWPTRLRLRETPEEIEYELRAAVGAYWTGGRLLIGIFTFLFASLAFAYFYLRSNNCGNCGARTGSRRRPASVGRHLRRGPGLGPADHATGPVRLRTGSTLDWEVAVGRRAGRPLLAIGLQVWELTQLPFFPARAATPRASSAGR